MGVLYALEPLLTVIFVTNMNIVWEKVMSTLRAQIFGRILIQKVKPNLSNFPANFKLVLSDNAWRYLFIKTCVTV